MGIKGHDTRLQSNLTHEGKELVSCNKGAIEKLRHIRMNSRIQTGNKPPNHLPLTIVCKEARLVT